MTGLNVTESLPVRTQFLIFTLFGEFVVKRGGKIWTGSLLKLMDLLGVSERAVRSTLSRMTRKGWLKPQKFGRKSQYTLTAKGRALLDSGQQRIFEPQFTDWDNQWHLVVYSLPEKNRQRRHALRKQLAWLGFGNLAPGTWISPHDRRKELKDLFVDLDVEPFVELFAGVYLGPASAHELVHRCWDLGGLAEHYRNFIDRYEPQYQACRADGAAPSPPEPAECFVRRFWMIHEFQSIPFKDPNLPDILLPPDWIGYAARKLFENYRTLLVPKADQFVDDVMACEDLVNLYEEAIPTLESSR